MTLIAIDTGVDHAHLLTDTLSYTVTGSRLGRSSKVHVLPHLDAAVTTHGSAELGNFWDVHAALRAGAATFDELTDAAPDALRALWAEITTMAEHRSAIHGGHRMPPRSVAFAVGYSERAGRFRAVAHSSDDAFEPVDLTGLFVIPSPLDVRPSDLELARLADTFSELHDDVAPVDALAALPAPVAPTDEAGWVNLARRARADRALADLYSGLKMYVAGDAILTRIERGASSSRRVHTFDDAGVEFERMMAGSLHPVGQLGPCSCGSGERLVECCLRAIFDDPCPCGSGSTFTDCCRVEVPAPTTTTVGARASRNGPCPCGSGSKYKHCCARVAASA